MFSSSAAIHLGLIAACFVLLVPMALAGLHISRHKLLFSSAALFFSLFLIVHVSPFLPSLHPPSKSNPSPTPSLSPSQTLALLNASYISIAGDSQARLFTLSLLSLLVLDPAAMDEIRSDLFRRHSDYHIEIPDHGLALDFVWSPFESNISSFLQDLNHHHQQRRPDVVVAGSGLWHMLHVTNASDYGERLREVRDAVAGLEVRSHLFWMGLPVLLDDLLNTEEKRVKMNSTVREEYEREVERSGILRRDRGPFSTIDMGRLSRECRCAADGMHYDRAVYDAAVQMMLGDLVIETVKRYGSSTDITLNMKPVYSRSYRYLYYSISRVETVFWL